MRVLLRARSPRPLCVLHRRLSPFGSARCVVRRHSTFVPRARDRTRWNAPSRVSCNTAREHRYSERLEARREHACC